MTIENQNGDYYLQDGAAAIFTKTAAADGEYDLDIRIGDGAKNIDTGASTLTLIVTVDGCTVNGGPTYIAKVAGVVRLIVRTDPIFVANGDVMTATLQSDNLNDGSGVGTDTDVTVTPRRTVDANASGQVTTPDTQKVDVDTIKTQTITCGAAVTVGVYVGNAAAALSVDGSGRTDVGSWLGVAPLALANQRIQGVTTPLDSGVAVNASGYPTGDTTDTWGQNAPVLTRTYMNGGHQSRIRWSGSVLGARVYLTTSDGWANLVSIQFRVFRWNGATYDTVGSSDVIPNASLSENALNTLTFSTPITGVLRGDLLGIEVITTDDWHGIGYSDDKDTFGANNWTVSYSDGSISSAGITWGTTIADRAMMMNARMSPPVWMTAGDSFAAGHDLTLSFLESCPTTWTDQNIEQNLLGYAEDIDPVRFNYANFGIGSTTSTDWATGSTDLDLVLAALPRYVLFSLGSNDITGTLSKAERDTFTLNLKGIAQRCLLTGITPVFMTLPHTDSNKPCKRAMNNIIQQICEENQLFCLDSWSVLKGNATEDLRNTSLFGSGTHPNADGYKTLGTLLASQNIRV